MKKIILLTLIALMMVGCVYRTDAETEEQKRLKGFKIVVIDGCEYIQRTEIMVHKGNCKFCTERRNKELEELVIKLKER